jgi:Mrp family chromosome partitioning ATPase
VGRIIAVGSGKGGVGKSTVSALLASALNKAGYSVGVLDADVTGPSIPRLLGVNKAPYVQDNKIQMPASSRGVKVLSVNLLLRDDGAPVVWRGPLISGTIKQFWEDGAWNGLDFAIIDLPPGTADAPLTVMQTVRVDGMIAVTMPQGLSSMIVQKQIHLSEMMNVPLLGLIENMSYAVCPHCGEKLAIFGESRLEEVAKELGLPVLAQLPIDPALAKLCDEGKMEQAKSEEMEQAAKKIAELLPERA